MRWKLTVRAGPKVQRSTFASLDQALEALEARGRTLSDAAPREVVDAKIRRFEPAQQVFARLELSGPERFVASVRAGVDVHGDGRTEAYLGRVRRQPIEPGRRESTYEALRRSLA